jgi:gamma-glutamyltranspeptidase/glutathione hydrolase
MFDDLDYRQPYASARSPVMGKNMVACSQPLAAQAGLDMLRRGGNAVDAAIAAAMVLTVVEPTGCGIGSDAFAIVWDGQQLQGLNASGRSPKAWTPEHFAGQTEMPQRGWGAVTVPGAVSAWVALSDRYGKLPFATLAEPAIGYARDGYQVTPIIAELWRRGAGLMLPARRRGAETRREDQARRPRSDLAIDCAEQGRVLLPRRAGPGNHRPCSHPRQRDEPG